MELLNKEAFTQLAQVEETPAVSIYLPLEREIDQQDQNRIRLKNLLAAAETRLRQQYEWTAPEVADFLQPATRLIEDGRFQGVDGQGMALFLAPGWEAIYILPLSFAEAVMVGHHFYLKPLLPLFLADGRFYILALSQNEIRLLEATAHSAQEMILPDEVPPSLAEALKWEDPEERLHWHTSTAPTTIRQPRRAMFHGHGVTTQEGQKEQILAYFRQVDEGISELLRGEGAPLVLAGVQYLLPLYQKANHYPHLLKDGIHGNPETLSAAALREQAWEIVVPTFAQARQAAAERYADRQSTDLATDDLEAVVAAAHYGQVDTLFIDEESQQWGVFDAGEGRIRQRTEPYTGTELLDRTAVQTFLQGGTVFSLPPADMPTASPAAALLRAPLYTAD